mgnify:CR=1 FL=1
MSAAAEWMVSENGRSLNLVVERETFATITRWADRKTGEHAWWAVERHDGYGLGLSEHLASACRRAAAAANIDLAPPQDLIDEWGHEDPEEQEAERSTPVASEPALRRERVKAVEAAPAPVSAQPAAIARPARPDDLKAISGIGPKLEKTLNGLGIWTYAQIAALGTAEIAWLDEKLGFAGRIGRDDWTGQAGRLAGS